MTYVAISAPFLLLAGALSLRCWRRHPRQGRVTAAVLAIVLALTIVFDNLMIAFGNVAYGESKNLGIFLGHVPVEDLFYPVFAVLIITALWPDSSEEEK